MKNKSIESYLNINLNELVHFFARELAMGLKKFGIYGSGHPSSIKALEKPYVALGRILKIKKYVNINLQNGYLHILNIRLKDSIFNQEIIKFMQLLDITAILFESQVSVPDFGKFCDRFVKRVDISDHANQLNVYLKENKISTIEVNSERGFWFFENLNQFRGDVDYDASIKNIVTVQLPDDLEKLAKLFVSDDVYVIKSGYDYNFEIVQYMIPEKIASMRADQIKSQLVSHLEKLNNSSDDDERDKLLELGKIVYQLINYHPEKEQIIKKYDILGEDSNDFLEQLKDFQSPTGKIKLETSNVIEELIKEIFDVEALLVDSDEFSHAFSRLVKTGQKDKAEVIISDFIDKLSSESFNERQKALSLLLQTVKHFGLMEEFNIFDPILTQVASRVTDKKETYEFSEFIWKLIETTIKNSRFDRLAGFVQVLNDRRKVEDMVTVYDSMVIKKIFTDLNKPEIIKILIDELLTLKPNSSQAIREVLTNIGSEEVAIALSDIISHPTRQVRQQALKILGEMGKPALKVFSSIITDDFLFEREEDRHELPDEKWYIIRNSIFVLGLLEDIDGIMALRQRINDPDIRVRREIITALEKIGGEDACDIFMMMSNDSDKEIRENAVLKIGLIGSSEMAPLLIDLAKTNPNVVEHAINSLGQLGGNDAVQFLVDILENKISLEDLSAGQISKENLKLAIIKALGRIGNQHSIDKLREYKDGFTTTQKIFFKNSPVNKAIEEILSKK